MKTKQTIKIICNLIEKRKQERIKKIVKRLNEMSPNDVFMLARILKV